MKVEDSKSIMASYATFKELYNSEKYHNPYQILSEFIRYVIISKAHRSFTAVDIQGDLMDEFGFNPPLSVVVKTLKRITEVSYKKDHYETNGIQDESSFRTVRNIAEQRNRTIIDSLVRYAHSVGIKDLKEDKLAQNFIAFVLDEDGDSSYKKLIGEFIIVNENNKEITNTISAIREGSILYSGLAFNIDEFGILKKPLTIFLDTEIIFNIAGLNGELYKCLADDFIELVKKANRGQKVISLKYFSRVADEIDKFYLSAERIISGKGDMYVKPAMRAIIEGCHTPADVSEKRSELYDNLQHKYAIFKDEKENYYSKADEPYNLEGLQLEDFPYTEEANVEGFIFCSHVNKLRKGVQTEDCLSSGYLFITDTAAVLNISKELRNKLRDSKGKEYCGYADSLSSITNKLWYKLNSGFGSKVFPQNLDVVIKARTILASYISGEIATHYDEINSKFKSGDLTREQACLRIAQLKKKVDLPEELDSLNVEENLDFSDKYLAWHEESLSQANRRIEEKDREIGNLHDVKRELQEQLAEAGNQISSLTERLKAIEERENERNNKKKKKKERIAFIWSVTWKPIVVGMIIWVVWGVCRVLERDFPTWLSIVLTVGGAIPTFFSNFKKRWQEYKEKTAS